ncbi:MAG: DUF2993 domain-containing protein [Sulfobacillus acidophilus]|uniref:DUF2993 domain-containing protein n=1 Tax=Sulfobacillus acidophilus TaxID=53633 RepID=A0A2T2WFB5_9FIRM|nr:MAG: DUF2993 domain-containing protein [Sulfobacillus acidophilus]
MSRVIQTLIILVVVVAVLQWFVPRWAADLVANELGRIDHGPRPSVAVTAVPFWDLLQGRFQDIRITAKQAQVRSLQIHQIRMNWSNGQVALAALAKGRLGIRRPGHLVMTIVLTGTAMSRFLAKTGSIVRPHVDVSPQGIRLQGEIQLAGTAVPLDMAGSLVKSANSQALIFHPHQIDGVALPVLTNVQLLNVASLHLPLPLTIDRVRLERNQIALTAGN